MLLNQNPVVMVDDNSDEIFLAQRCFTMSSLQNEFTSYTEVQSFLDFLKSIKQNKGEMPALVLMDINMPIMSGFDVLALIREDSFFDQLPIIIITNSSEDRDLQRSKALGANAFQMKPQSIGEYVAFFDSLKSNERRPSVW